MKLFIQILFLLLFLSSFVFVQGRIKDKIYEMIEATPDEMVYALSFNDPLYSLQRNIFYIGLEDIPELNAYESYKGNVEIWIMDTGLCVDTLGRLTHPDLDPEQFTISKNYMKVYRSMPRFANVDDTTIWLLNQNWDQSGHGTHVAGTIAAIPNNNEGVVGIDWSTPIKSVKVLRDEDGWGYFSRLTYAGIDALDYCLAITKDVVINLSLGASVNYKPFERLVAVSDSLRKELGYGLIFICSAGNNYSESLVYPAAYSKEYDNVISVGSVYDSSGIFRKTYYSAYGDDINVWAYGGYGFYKVLVDTEHTVYNYKVHPSTPLSTYPDSLGQGGAFDNLVKYLPDFYSFNYGWSAGTSMATPEITAAVARFLDNNPGYDLVKLKERLRDTGTKFDYFGTMQDSLGNWIDDSSYIYEGSVIYLPGFWDKVSGVNNNKDIIADYSLKSYPNPFNSSTTLLLDINHSSLVELKVYDILGREITTLVNEHKQVGRYEIDFSASKLSSGIYFCNLRARNFSKTIKLQLLR